MLSTRTFPKQSFVASSFTHAWQYGVALSLLTLQEVWLTLYSNNTSLRLLRLLLGYKAFVMTGPSFLSIPYELRQGIYKNLLTADDIQVLTLDDTWGLHLSILRVNKQIHGEAVEVLCQSTGWILFTGLNWNEYCRVARPSENADTVLRSESLTNLIGSIPMRQLEESHRISNALIVHLGDLESLEGRCDMYSGPKFMAPALAMPHLMLLIEALDFDSRESVADEDSGTLEELWLNHATSKRQFSRAIVQPKRNVSKIGVLDRIFVIKQRWITDASGVWEDVLKQTLSHCRSEMTWSARLMLLSAMVDAISSSVSLHERACISIHALRLGAWFHSIVEEEEDKSVPERLDFFTDIAIRYCRSVGNVRSVKVILDWYINMQPSPVAFNYMMGNACVTDGRLFAAAYFFWTSRRQQWSTHGEVPEGVYFGEMNDDVISRATNQGDYERLRRLERFGSLLGRSTDGLAYVGDRMKHDESLILTSEEVISYWGMTDEEWENILERRRRYLFGSEEA